MRLLILMLLSTSLFGQSDLLEVEVTKQQEGPDIILLAKNHTDSTYIVTVDVQSHGMKLSRAVPFDVRVSGGNQVRLITLTPIPGKPWSYRQSYSFKPVPPPVAEREAPAPVSDAVQEVLEILNREEAVSKRPEQQQRREQQESEVTIPETQEQQYDPYDEPAEVRGVSIESEELPEPAITMQSRISRNEYIPLGVSNEFGHGTPPSASPATSKTPANRPAMGAYIPLSVALEFASARPSRRPDRATNEAPAVPPSRAETSRPSPTRSQTTGKVLGLRTVAYRVPDIAEGRDWYTKAFNTEPYFDEPFYVGFNIGGYELGLQPLEGNMQPPGEGVVSYWGVEDIEATYAHFVRIGAESYEPVQDVGGGIQAGAVKDPWGNVIGLIYNPHFKGN